MHGSREEVLPGSNAISRKRSAWRPVSGCWKSGWQKKFLDVAEKHPIFIGECGAPNERLHFIPESQHEDAETWVPDFLGLLQKHKLHWTAWSFHPKASPVLLEDWDYTPTSYWGVHAKDALHGKQFEMKKMR